MVDLNSVIISGRVVADSVSKMTTSGKELTSFGIACNDDYKNKNSGEWVNRAYFFNCVYWKNLVLKKGEPIVIYGKLETNTEEYNGQKRTFVKISATKVVKINIEKKSDTVVNNVDTSNEVGSGDYSYADQDKIDNNSNTQNEYIPF